MIKNLVIFFHFCLKLCYVCCVVYAKLYFFVFLMIHKAIFKINENRRGLVVGAHKAFFHLEPLVPYLLCPC